MRKIMISVGQARWFERLIPFISLGVFLVMLVVGLLLVSYLLLFGALVGIVLYIVAWVRGWFRNKHEMD